MVTEVTGTRPVCEEDTREMKTHISLLNFEQGWESRRVESNYVVAILNISFNPLSLTDL